MPDKTTTRSPAINEGMIQAGIEAISGVVTGGVTEDAAGEFNGPTGATETGLVASIEIVCRRALSCSKTGSSAE
jgi:hypothetical protein